MLSEGIWRRSGTPPASGTLVRVATASLAPLDGRSPLLSRGFWHTRHAQMISVTLTRRPAIPTELARRRPSVGDAPIPVSRLRLQRGSRHQSKGPEARMLAPISRLRPHRLRLQCGVRMQRGNRSVRASCGLRSSIRRVHSARSSDWARGPGSCGLRSSIRRVHSARSSDWARVSLPRLGRLRYPSAGSQPPLWPQGIGATTAAP